MLILTTFGITYAFWIITKEQTNQNVINSACIKFEIINEANDILLTDQYPITDVDGMKLTPYTFTVKNNCSSAIAYQVALESTGNSESNISTQGKSYCGAW